MQRTVEGDGYMENTTGPAIPGLASYRAGEVEFERYEIPAEDIIEGAPYAEVASYFESPDGGTLIAAARIGEGKYRYRQTADEINYVLAGRMIIESERTGERIECGPGSVTRLNAGDTYGKTVLEAYEEVAVMTSSSGVQM